jgi:hypothetical protein
MGRFEPTFANILDLFREDFTTPGWGSPRMPSAKPNGGSRFPRTEDDIADRYSGCGWGDETERRLLDDVFDGQRRGFFR